MDLWPRQRQSFSGFTLAEVEKMEYLHKESSEQSLNEEFYKNLARLFNRSSGRAGKPVVKWTEIQTWFEDRQRLNPSRETSRVAAETASIPEGTKSGGPSQWLVAMWDRVSSIAAYSVWR